MAFDVLGMTQTAEHIGHNVQLRVDFVHCGFGVSAAGFDPLQVGFGFFQFVLDLIEEASDTAGVFFYGVHFDGSRLVIRFREKGSHGNGN